MRVTDRMTSTSVLSNLNRNRSEMTDLQNQASTLKRVTKPSDDPLASTRILQARTEDKNYLQFQKNITGAKAMLDFTDQTLNELSDALVRTKELAIQAANDSGGETPRLIASAEVEQLYSQILNISNRKFGDKFLFGGFKTTTQPFDSTGTYHGDTGDIKIQTQKGAFVSLNLSGDKVFQGKDLGKADPVTDGEVVQTAQALKETKVKEQQQKQLEAEMADQDATVLTRGPASEGHPQKLNNKDIVSGDKAVNIFSIVRSLEIAMKTNDKAGIQDSIEELDNATNQVIMARAEVGARVNTISNAFEGLQRSVLDNKALMSQMEDADMFQVMSDITKTDSTLKATMESSSKMMNQSLMDFLR